eukprot:470058-Rhodomonas_salina.1
MPGHGSGYRLPDSQRPDQLCSRVQVGRDVSTRAGAATASVASSSQSRAPSSRARATEEKGRDAGAVPLLRSLDALCLDRIPG